MASITHRDAFWGTTACIIFRAHFWGKMGSNILQVPFWGVMGGTILRVRFSVFVGDIRNKAVQVSANVETKQGWTVSRASTPILLRSEMKREAQYVICIGNKGYTASLEFAQGLSGHPGQSSIQTS